MKDKIDAMRSQFNNGLKKAGRLLSTTTIPTDEKDHSNCVTVLNGDPVLVTSDVVIGHWNREAVMRIDKNDKNVITKISSGLQHVSNINSDLDPSQAGVSVFNSQKNKDFLENSSMKTVIPPKEMPSADVDSPVAKTLSDNSKSPAKR